MTTAEQLLHTLPAERDTWHRAAQAALHFWAQASADPRISPPFRQRCAQHADMLSRTSIMVQTPTHTQG